MLFGNISHSPLASKTEFAMVENCASDGPMAALTGWWQAERQWESLASKKCESFCLSISWLLSSLLSWWCISGKVTEKSPEHEINTEYKWQQRVILLSSATEGSTAGNIEIVHQRLRVGQCGLTSNHRGAEHQLRPKAAFFLLVLG